LKTDQLIDALSRGVEPAEKPRWKLNLAITLAVGLVVAVALVAIGLGLVAAGLVSGLPPMASGGVGATVAVLTYAPLWFLGIRWRTGDRPEAT